MTGVLIRRGEQHVMTKAEIGVMYLQTKECQELLVTPEARRKTEQILNREFMRLCLGV